MLILQFQKNTEPQTYLMTKQVSTYCKLPKEQAKRFLLCTFNYAETHHSSFMRVFVFIKYSKPEMVLYHDLHLNYVSLMAKYSFNSIPCVLPWVFKSYNGVIGQCLEMQLI